MRTNIRNACKTTTNVKIISSCNVWPQTLKKLGYAVRRIQIKFRAIHNFTTKPKLEPHKKPMAPKILKSITIIKTIIRAIHNFTTKPKIEPHNKQ